MKIRRCAAFADGIDVGAVAPDVGRGTDLLVRGLPILRSDGDDETRDFGVLDEVRSWKRAAAMCPPQATATKPNVTMVVFVNDVVAISLVEAIVESNLTGSPNVAQIDTPRISWHEHSKRDALTPRGTKARVLKSLRGEMA